MKDIVGGAAGTEEATELSQPAQPPSQESARDPLRTRLEALQERLARCEEMARQEPSAAADELVASLRSQVAETEKRIARFRRAGKLARKERPRCGAPRRRDWQPCQGRAVWDEENDRPRTRNGRCKHHGGNFSPSILTQPRDASGRFIPRENSGRQAFTGESTVEADSTLPDGQRKEEPRDQPGQQPRSPSA